MAGKAVRVDQYLLGQGEQHRIVWMWYLAGDRFTASPYWCRSSSKSQSRSSSGRMPPERLFVRRFGQLYFPAGASCR